MFGEEDQDEYDILMDSSLWTCDIDGCGQQAINGFEVEVEVEDQEEDEEVTLLVRYCGKHTAQAEEYRRALVGGAQ